MHESKDHHYTGPQTRPGQDASFPWGIGRVLGRATALVDQCGEARMETFAVAYGEFVGAVVGGQDKNVARGVENGGADLAGLEVLLDGGEQLGIELLIQVAGNVFPNVFAFQLHENHLRKKPLRGGAWLLR